jgi:heme-degrading monooxygenase HmoA
VSEAPLQQGIDYTLDELGRMVFTREYHLKRGSCCRSGCRNCPYGFARVPYYAVIFSSALGRGEGGLTPEQRESYEKTAAQMLELAARQPGFVRVESVRGADGRGITISYWKTEEDIRRWRENAEHTIARAKGREEWYRSFDVRVCRVEREYGSL